MQINKFSAVVLAALAAGAMSGCGAIDSILEDSSVSSATETAATSRQYVQTTKTMSKAVTADVNDEDEEGYTTTREVTGSLENTYTEPDTPDEDILATFSTTTTLYTIPAGAEIKTTASDTETTSETETTTEKTTAKTTTVTTTTTTAFNADALYNPTDGDVLKEKVKYHVVSDTTYLNLRFGPSKTYSVQLKIPDGEYVYGTAETSNPDNADEKWVYVSYNGTNGWVMRDLLETAE